jgi:hypothetical protein
MEHEDVYPVVLNGITVKDPRAVYDRCEAIYHGVKWREKKGLIPQPRDHKRFCNRCPQLIDACHDAAYMREFLTVLNPDATVPPIESVIATETVDFEIQEK